MHYKNKTELVPIKLASLSHEALCSRLSIYMAENLAGLPSLSVFHTFQVFAFMKEATPHG